MLQFILMDVYFVSPNNKETLLIRAQMRSYMRPPPPWKKQTFWVVLLRGSYMSAHVFFNLLDELGKR